MSEQLNEMTDKTRPVGIWIRVSTEDQAKGDSPEHHEHRARLHAETRGWKVVEVYHLEATSGKSVMEHSETKRMLKDVRIGRISGLIFSKLARLARNTKELLEFADYFAKYDAALVSLQESIDTSTPVGRLFYTIIAAMAQWEREEISDRISASIPIRAKMGKPIGGKAPFGYQWKEGKFIPHPEEAPVCKKVFELFLEHKRLKTVARLLNKAGYRTSKGAEFYDRTIHRILINPAAKGKRRANYTKNQGKAKTWKIKPEKDWVYHDVEPIVSEELWNQCNFILEERQKNSKPAAKKTVQLFSGLLYCQCGNKMYVPSTMTNKYVCQKCRNKIPSIDLENIFYHQIKTQFLSSSEIEKYLKKVHHEINEKEELFETLQKEEKRVNSELDFIYELRKNGDMEPKEYRKRNSALHERRKQLQEEIPSLQSEIDYIKIAYLSSDQILNEARDLHTRWPELNIQSKRQIVENITNKINIGKNQIDIDLSYLPASEFTANGQHID